MKIKTEWQGGGTYLHGTCDIPGCENNPNLRNWEKDPFGMSGDDECIASLCNEHAEYKQYHTTEQILKAFSEKK